MPPHNHGIDKIASSNVTSIVCHRRNSYGIEEYLVKWRVGRQYKTAPYSWHNTDELSGCLRKLQKYLDVVSEKRAQLDPRAIPGSRKRRSPDNELVDSRSSFRSSPTVSSANSSVDNHVISKLDINSDAYYGTLLRENGEIKMIPSDKPNGPIEHLPTPSMEKQALEAGYDHTQAYHRIRSKFTEHLSRTVGPSEAPVTLVNNVDRAVPSLNFKFINNYVFREGVQEPDRNAIVGCGQEKLRYQYCRPNMGQHIGCEYSKVCECLEFAAVDETRLTEEQKAILEKDSDAKTGLPKRFPYSSRRLLVHFYLESRHPIYECNFRCNCREVCKTRLVQHGRQVPLEIFKTTNRGWGLRCSVELKRGQFIDTYRGEVITNGEADKREVKQKGKASYLYNLDKHTGEELAKEDSYVVDGEYYGGPTRFMNHSCEPNCRQYTVSYDRYNTLVYDLAFFAYQDIPAYTELTFDYLDKDDEDEEEDPPAASQQSQSEENVLECKCGSARCRRKLWM